MKILLTSVSAGSGHLRAAEAVQSSINRYFTNIETLHIDIMNYVPAFFRKFYVGGYSLAANRLPRIWGTLFSSTDKDNVPGQAFMNRVQFKLCSQFIKLIKEFKPDIIVSTHFLLPQILPHLRKHPGFNVPVHCVVTDFYAHQFWLDKNVQKYYVAQEKTADRFIRLGYDPKQIIVSGIPIRTAFGERVEKEKILTELNLEANIPTVLLLSGGLGFGDLAATVKSIFDMPHKIQIITVSGKNAHLHSKLQKLSPPPHMKTIHLGYVTNMHELLSVTDIVVSKAGGLTVSECLAKGNAMVLYPVIPGQEEKNCEFVESVGAGVVAKSLPHLKETIKQLLGDPVKVAQIKNRAFAHAKPAAALTVAQNVMGSLINT